MEPRQLVQRAKEVGLDGVCITEHNAAWEEETLWALAEESGLCLLGGIEVSSEVGDILVFGVREPILSLSKDSLLPGRRIADLRRLVDEAGGVMIAAHPFRWYSLPGAILDEEEAAERAVFRMVDAVEVFNGASPRAEAEFGCRVLARLGLAGVGGSDSHAPHSVGRCYTEFKRGIGSVQELVAEIKGGRFRAVYPGLSLVWEGEALP